MTIKEAKEIDMVAYLSAQGHQPTRIHGVNHWYLSPLRSERTPSFKVNQSLNRWYDFGIGKGGNLLDLVLLLDEQQTIVQALESLTAYHPNPSDFYVSERIPAAIEIIGVHLISSFALARYCADRRIPGAIADAWLKEIRYAYKGRKYFALGFKNDAGGYELRSPVFKGGCSPKTVTRIVAKNPRLTVFEGFFDFLSYLSMVDYQAAPETDYLILNSLSFFEQQLPFMQSYERVYLYLDNDAAGNRSTEQATQLHPVKFQDERKLYHLHKDLNDWLMHIGMPSIKTFQQPKRQR